MSLARQRFRADTPQLILAGDACDDVVGDLLIADDVGVTARELVQGGDADPFGARQTSHLTAEPFLYSSLTSLVILPRHDAYWPRDMMSLQKRDRDRRIQSHPIQRRRLHLSNVPRHCCLTLRAPILRNEGDWAMHGDEVT